MREDHNEGASHFDAQKTQTVAMTGNVAYSTNIDFLNIETYNKILNEYLLDFFTVMCDYVEETAQGVLTNGR